MISNVLIRVSLVLALIGMAGGIAMGMAQNFILAPAHAHLNLVGFVMLFLAALYYNAMPQIGRLGIAKVQALLAIAGAIVLPVGISVVLIKGPSYEAVPIAGSLIVFAATATLCYIVMRYGFSRTA